jgi:hypothetical protein
MWASGRRPVARVRFGTLEQLALGQLHSWAQVTPSGEFLRRQLQKFHEGG